MKLQDLKSIVAEGDVIQGNFPQKGKVILAMRRDAGDEWKYWTGINWFGTKDKARAVEVTKVDDLLDDWGLDASKRTWSGEVRSEKI